MTWFDASLETGNEFYTWGWRGSIIGALVTAVSVIFLMWGTRIRDNDTELQLRTADRRAASLETASKEALAEQQALKAENSNLAGQLKKIRQPRKISDEASSRIAGILRQSGSHQYQIFYLQGDEEAKGLAEQLNRIFSAADWTIAGTVMPQLDLVNPIPQGLQFGVKSYTHMPPALVPFIDALRGDHLVGATAPVALVTDLEGDDTISIRVGQKPL